MQSVILCGGLGTRLRPLTDTVPKPMISINGRPFLEYVVALLKKNSITDIFLLTGYLGDTIERYFGNGDAFGVHINYSREHKPLGVVGALRLAYPKLADSFLLLYGDNFLLLDYKELINFFEHSGKRAVVVSYQYKNEVDRGDDYSHNLCINKGGYVTQYKQGGIKNGTHAEAGAMLLRKKDIFSIPETYSNNVGEVLFPELIRRNELITYVSKNRFLDIGTLERLKKAEAFLVDYKL